MDDATGMKWSFFLKTKDQLPNKVIPFLKELKARDSRATKYIFVKYLRCDNAGENLLLETKCKEEGFGIQFEFTSAGTPQQNGVVERAFATLWGRVRAMLNHARLPKDKRNQLWAECAGTATKLENLMCSTMSEVSPHEQFYGELPKYSRHLRVFGEIGIVSDYANMKIRGKLADRGKPCLFVGYPENHASDVFRMINLQTNKVILTRDVIWLHQVYGVYKGLTQKHVTPLPNGDDNDDDDTVQTSKIRNEVEPAVAGHDGDGHMEDFPVDQINDINASDSESVASIPNHSDSRLQRELQKLDTFYNPTMKWASVEHVEIAFVSHISDRAYIEPQTFNEAWYHPDQTEQKSWREAIRKEFNCMVDKDVWEYITKTNIPKDRKLIGSKWVFKQKKNGVYRARLVALGYNQVPGVDFTESYAPVIHDVTYRIVILLWIMKKWESTILDVETAFLYGELNEDIYMKMPNGLREYFEEQSKELSDDEALKLRKSIYGLVQAARQWWTRFTDVLVTEMGFDRSLIDPCLLRRNNIDGEVILCLYVDDVLCVGDGKAVANTASEMGAKFSIKNQGPLTEYVGCKFISNVDRSKVWVTQPDLIKRLEAKFGSRVSTMQVYSTPAAAGEIVMRPKDQDELLGPDLQKDYRSGVGMLLYLIKHSRPAISNAVRELSKVMDGATVGHLKGLYRTIKFILDTRHVSLVMKPNMAIKWQL